MTAKGNLLKALVKNDLRGMNMRINLINLPYFTDTGLVPILIGSPGNVG